MRAAREMTRTPHPHALDRPAVPSHSRGRQCGVRRSGAARPTTRRPGTCGGHRATGRSRCDTCAAAATATGTRPLTSPRGAAAEVARRPRARARSRWSLPHRSPSGRSAGRRARRGWSAGCPGAHAPPS
uniref:Uncharacterized protein n=1 Tax=Setaria viridis TaxID=4556 RepID=A0A4U6VDD6_SETVI|nr:hypothetical protein SEVIR_3G251350v2 [Setaria viridis]